MSLRVVDVGKRLGGRWVLRRLGLTVDGGATAVLGPNGAGKTTLLRLVAGVLAPDEGQVFLRGRPLSRARADLGYVPEAADPPRHLTVAELLALVAALRRAAPLAPALAAKSSASTRSRTSASARCHSASAGAPAWARRWSARRGSSSSTSRPTASTATASRSWSAWSPATSPPAAAP
jgi:ABC-type sugar transport system ATPase subunit